MGDQWIDSREGMTENRLVQVTEWKTVEYTDEAQEVEICWLPENAWVIDVFVVIGTAFNDSGTDTLQVGISGGTTAEFLAAASCASTGNLIGSQAGTPLVPYAPLTAEKKIVAVYNGQNNNASAGSARVAIMWAPGFPVWDD